MNYDSEGVSIVLVGNFNPAIFQPAWFILNGLLPEYDSKDQKIVILPEICQFQLDWLRIEVTGNRFLAATQHPENYSALRDLVISTFSILEHTPVKQLGINKDVHYNAEDENVWHKIGDTLAPKDIWKETLKKPGLTALKIQSPRNDKLPGNINIHLAPSSQLKQYGVHVSVNHHIELTELLENKEQAVHKSIQVLESHWDHLLQSADEIIETTLTKAMQC